MIKKTCNGCKAWCDVSRKCALDYSMKVVYYDIVPGTPAFHGVPLEECPKPRTNNNLIYLSNIRQGKPS